MLERLLIRLHRYGPPSGEEVDALRAIMGPPRKIAAGQEVIRQFAVPTESTLLISGMMGRLVTLRGGSQQITALQVAGDFVDLHGFLLARMDHSVVAITDCVMSSAAHADLRALMDKYPRLGRSLWYLTLVDASIHRHWLTVIGRRDAVGRTAHLICELYIRLKDVGLVENDAFEMPLTQANAGDVLGLSAVHVNRVIQELRNRGLVRWDRRNVQVKDWEGLCQLAEFEPTYLQRVDQVEH